MKNKRKKILGLVRRLFKIKRGQRYPKWILRLIVYPLYPLKAIWFSNPWFTYDIETDSLNVYGVTLGIDFLKDLANKPVGHTFRIKEKRDGLVVIENLIIVEVPGKAVPIH